MSLFEQALAVGLAVTAVCVFIGYALVPRRRP